MQTGPNSVQALNLVTFHPYSDFLLHNMGALGDGIHQGIGTGPEMRTAPLWGLRKLPFFLHDGRATTVHQAIQLHDGQGLGAEPVPGSSDCRPAGGAGVFEHAVIVVTALATVMIW